MHLSRAFALLTSATVWLTTSPSIHAQPTPVAELRARSEQLSARCEAEGLAEPFRDIRHLDTTLGELNGGNFTRYGELRF